MQKLQLVLLFKTDSGFSPAERAALRYTHQATEVGARETFAELKNGNREILELTIAIATKHVYNRLNAPLEIESQSFSLFDKD